MRHTKHVHMDISKSDKVYFRDNLFDAARFHFFFTIQYMKMTTALFKFLSKRIYYDQIWIWSCSMENKACHLTNLDFDLNHNKHIEALPLYRIKENFETIYWIKVPFTFLQYSNPGNYQHITKMSSNGNIFRVTGHLCGHRWITRTKASDAELWCFLWSAPE